MPGRARYRDFVARMALRLWRIRDRVARSLRNGNAGVSEGQQQGKNNRSHRYERTLPKILQFPWSLDADRKNKTWKMNETSFLSLAGLPGTAAERSYSSLDLYAGRTGFRVNSSKGPQAVSAWGTTASAVEATAIQHFFAHKR